VRQAEEGEEREVLQCIAVLQCVVVCCSELQCVAVGEREIRRQAGRERGKEGGRGAG